MAHECHGHLQLSPTAAEDVESCSSSPETVFISSYLYTCRSSQTTSVSTAPISKHVRVSATPKTYLPVSCSTCLHHWEHAYSTLAGELHWTLQKQKA